MKYKVIKAFPSTQKNWKVGDIISPNGFKGTCEIAPNWPEYFEEYNPILTTKDEVDLFEGDSYYFAWLKEPAHNQKILTPYYVNKITGLDSVSSFSKDAVFFKYLFKLEIYLKSLKPKPLFVTEDGVEIYEDQTTYGVNSDFQYTGEFKWISKYFYGDGKQVLSKLFSTKQAAEQYILMNKPCLSIKEIAPIIGFCNNTTYVDLDLLTKKLQKLVKDKI